MKLVNCTDGFIHTTDGAVIAPKLGLPATVIRFFADELNTPTVYNYREEAGYVEKSTAPIIGVTWAIENLPEPTEGVAYIVTADVLEAAKAQGRKDCVIPAYDHPGCYKHDKYVDTLVVPGFFK